MPYCVILYKDSKIEDEMCFMDFKSAFDHVTKHIVIKGEMTFKDANSILATSKQIAENGLTTDLINKEFRAWTIEDDDTAEIIFCTIKYTVG